MYRKVERVDVSLVSGSYWNEISFSELKEGNVFRITDVDDNGKTSIDGEDGKKVLIATSEPYTKNKTYVIEFEEYNGDYENITAN